MIHLCLGIVQKDEEFLLIKRVKPEGSLLRAFPGGKMEQHDKDTSAAAIREVLEETSIKSAITRHLGTRPINNNILAHYFLCDYIEGTPEAKIDEALECGWYSVANIYNLITSDLFPPVKEYLDSI